MPFGGAEALQLAVTQSNFDGALDHRDRRRNSAFGAHDRLDSPGRLDVLRIGHSVRDDGRFQRNDRAPGGKRLAHLRADIDHCQFGLPVHRRNAGHSSPRFARLRISAAVPKVQGSASCVLTITLVSRPSRRRFDGDDVADAVRKTLPLLAAVLGRREHRAEIEHETVRILVISRRWSGRRCPPGRG